MQYGFLSSEYSLCVFGTEYILCCRAWLCGGVFAILILLLRKEEFCMVIHKVMEDGRSDGCKIEKIGNRL